MKRRLSEHEEVAELASHDVDDYSTVLDGVLGQLAKAQDEAQKFTQMYRDLQGQLQKSEKRYSELETRMNASSTMDLSAWTSTKLQETPAKGGEDSQIVETAGDDIKTSSTLEAGTSVKKVASGRISTANKAD